MFFTSGVLFLLSAAVVVIFQPYKVRAHNTVDSSLMILTGIALVSNYADYHSKMARPFQTLITLLLVLCLIFLLMWKLAGGKPQSLVRRAIVVLSCIKHHHEHHGEAGIEEFDRGLGTSESSSYPPLLGESQKLTY
jgi:hypothetical protein